MKIELTRDQLEAILAESPTMRSLITEIAFPSAFVKVTETIRITSGELEEIRKILGREPRPGVYNKIDAIKRLREICGCGLKEAKDFVESQEIS